MHDRLLYTMHCISLPVVLGHQKWELVALAHLRFWGWGNLEAPG